MSVITLDGQCVGTKWLRFSVHQTEVCPRVPRGRRLDVEAEARAPLAPHDGESSISSWLLFKLFKKCPSLPIWIDE